MDSEEVISAIVNVWNTTNKISRPKKDVQPSKIVDQIANYFSPGQYYYYIFNFHTMKMDFVHENSLLMTGIPASELTLESMFSIYHPEDLKKLHEKESCASDFLFNRIPPEHLVDYKVAYLIRFQLKDGTIKKILHQAKAINVSEDGKIQQVIGIHTDISHLNTLLDDKISFISDKHPSYYSLDPKNLSLEINEKKLFTKQELKIIEKLSLGLTSKQIGEHLFISETTVNVHRKNILNKSDAENTAQLIANCIREGIIS